MKAEAALVNGAPGGNIISERVGPSMSEMRRRLFKGSVLSIFGATAIASLVACRRRFVPGGPDESFAFEPVFALSDDGTKWYVFAIDVSDRRQRQRAYWTAKGDLGSPPFDTVETFEHLDATGKLTIQSGPITLRSVTYDVDCDGYVEPQSSNQVYVNASKWNEINHSVHRQ